MKNRFLHILILVLCSITTQAQDPQFSQVFAVPLYLGPSFAGATSGTRVVSNFRDQWPAFNKEYISYSLSFDHYFNKTKSGVGFALFRDQAGIGLMSSTYAMLQYSYIIDITRKLQLRPGIEASFNTRSLNYNRIVFGDQLSFDATMPTTVETALNKSVSYVDFATSAVLFHPLFWLGFSVHHLTAPNQSLLGGVSKVPIKISLYGGRKIPLNNSRMARNRGNNLYVAFEFKRQAQFSQCYTGVYWEYTDFSIGLWYRGIPFYQTYQSYFNNDAAVIVLSYNFDYFVFGYSYDITTSPLQTLSSGSHEVSLAFKIITKTKKVWKMIPCPMP